MPVSSRLILAVAQLPTGPDALKLVAAIAGLPLSDVRLRLTGILPRVLLSDADTDALRELASELEKHGVATLCCDPAEAPSDGARIIARQIELSAEGLVVVDRASQRHLVPAASVALLQRGVRTWTSHQKVTTRERKLSLGRALISGGLLWSKAESKTTDQVSESRETFLLVQRSDVQPGVMLYERQLDYRFLGSAIQAAAATNFALTIERVRATVPQAPLDERVMQQAFVQALRPTAAGDPLDFALFLVRLARRPPQSPFR